MSLDVARAKITVKFARSAYREENQARAEVGLLGLRGFRWFSDSSTQAFTAVDDHFAYLSFRGTESDNPIDWIADGRFAPAAGVLGRWSTPGSEMPWTKFGTTSLPFSRQRVYRWW